MEEELIPLDKQPLEKVVDEVKDGGSKPEQAEQVKKRTYQNKREEAGNSI